MQVWCWLTCLLVIVAGGVNAHNVILRCADGGIGETSSKATLDHDMELARDQTDTGCNGNTGIGLGIPSTYYESIAVASPTLAFTMGTRKDIKYIQPCRARG
jgi:hypothetical protein